MSGTLFFKAPLSGSTDGRPISISNSAGSATTIHTAVSGTSDLDEIWLWADMRNNPTGLPEKLTILWGGTGTADEVTHNLRLNEVTTIVPGWVLRNGLIIKAYGGSGSGDINIYGYVNEVRANQ